MIKRIFKAFLVVLMILGIVISIYNFFPKKVDAKMVEELLHWYEIPGGYVYWCGGDGQGCYTVTPDPDPN